MWYLMKAELDRHIHTSAFACSNALQDRQRSSAYDLFNAFSLCLWSVKQFQCKWELFSGFRKGSTDESVHFSCGPERHKVFKCAQEEMSSNLAVSIGLYSAPHFWISWRAKAERNVKWINLVLKAVWPRWPQCGSCLLCSRKGHKGCSAASIVMKHLAENMVLLFWKSRSCFLSFNEYVYYILAFQRLPEGCVVV